MQQQPIAMSTPFSRLIPTRRAAMALLALDAVLVAVPLFIHWRNWFAFAYVPLLITVALGALMSGRGRLVAALTGIMIPVLLGVLWAVLKLSAPSTDMVGTTLRVGGMALACLGAVWLCISVWGWVRFFSGHPTAKWLHVIRQQAE